MTPKSEDDEPLQPKLIPGAIIPPEHLSSPKERARAEKVRQGVARLATPTAPTGNAEPSRKKKTTAPSTALVTPPKPVIEAKAATASTTPAPAQPEPAMSPRLEEQSTFATRSCVEVQHVQKGDLKISVLRWIRSADGARRRKAHGIVAVFFIAIAAASGGALMTSPGRAYGSWMLNSIRSRIMPAPAPPLVAPSPMQPQGATRTPTQQPQKRYQCWNIFSGWQPCD